MLEYFQIPKRKEKLREFHYWMKSEKKWITNCLHVYELVLRIYNNTTLQVRLSLRQSRCCVYHVFFLKLVVSSTTSNVLGENNGRHVVLLSF